MTLWDPTTGRELAAAHGRDNAYRSVTFSPDGQRVAGASEGDDGNSAELDLERRDRSQRKLRSRSPSSPTSSSRPTVRGARHPDATPSGSTASRPPTDRLRRSIATPGMEPMDIAAHAGSTTFAIGSMRTRQVQIRTVDTGALVREIEVTDAGALDWSPDGSRLAIAGGNESKVRVVDVASGEDVLVLRGHEGGSMDADFVGDSGRLASVGFQGDLRIWDITADGPDALGGIAPAHGAPLLHLSVPYDGHEVVFSSADHIERHDADTGALLGDETGQLLGNFHFPVPVSADGRFIASTALEDGSSTVRSLTSAMTAITLPPCTTPVGFSSDGEMLALNGLYACGLDHLLGRPVRRPRRSRAAEPAHRDRDGGRDRRPRYRPSHRSGVQPRRRVAGGPADGREHRPQSRWTSTSSRNAASSAR